MRNKTILLAAALALTPLSGRAQIDSDMGPGPESPSQHAIRLINNSVSFSLPTSRLNYGEPSQGAISAPYYDAENGYLHGFGIAASGMERQENVYARASYQLVTGPVSYVGTCGSSFTPCQGTSEARIGDGSLRVGRGFVTGDQFMVTPYAELGYHFWERNLNSSQHESYRHNTLGVGSMVQYAPVALDNGAGLVLTADFSIEKMFNADINAPGIPGTSGNLENAPLGEKKPVLQAGLDVDWFAANAVSFFAGFHYATFSYGASPVQSINAPPGTGVYEPQSYTYFWSYLVGLRISFVGLMSK